MNPRLRPLIFVLAVLATFVLAAPSCSESGRLDKVEDSMNRVSGMTARVNNQLVSLQTTTKGTDQQISEIRGFITEIQAALETLRNDVTALQSQDASLPKRIDDLNKKLSDLSAKLNAVDQRLWTLETRYNDHLRKYHPGG